MIGAGIFGLPARAYALAGAYSVLAYVAAALAIVLIVACFAEVSSRFKDTGGPYLYARAAFGGLVGFEVGWLMWLARIAGLAALGNLAVGYLAFFLPAVGAGPWRTVALTAAVVVLTAVNVAGLKLTAAVTNLFTIGKLVPLVLVAVAGLAFVEPGRFAFDEVPGYASFSQATLLLIYAFTGFEGAVIPAGEARQPTRQLPFALLTGIAGIVGLYVAVQAVCVGTVTDLASSERPVADAAMAFLGAPGAIFVTVGALVSIAGTLNALMFATPRLLFAMAEQGQLPSALGATHPVLRTPVLAVALTAAITLAFTLSSTFISAVAISAVIRLFIYALTCAALIVLRRRPSAAPAAFHLPGGTVVAAAAIGLSAWLLSNTSWHEARLSAMAALVGLVIYAVETLRRARSAPPATR